MTIPGVGPITEAALVALAPPAEAFRRGRDFSAWLGLTPLQRSSGGKQKLGQVSKMGERTLRRLLVIGASAVIKQALIRGAPGRLVARADAGPQAAHARHRRLGEQVGPHGLGPAGERRDLPSSGAGGLTVSV